MMKRFIPHQWAWWQLRLRTLMLVVLACGIVLSGVSYVLSRMRERQRTIDAWNHLRPFDPRFVEIRTSYVQVGSYPSDYWNDPFLQLWYQHFRRPHGKIACSFIGMEGSEVADRDLKLIRPWHEDSPVTAINLADTQVGDGGIAHLQIHDALTFLNLDRTQVTNAGLEHLKAFKQLRLLSLTGTQVTEDGVAGLQKELPYCWVQHDSLATTD